MKRFAAQALRWMVPIAAITCGVPAHASLMGPVDVMNATSAFASIAERTSPSVAVPGHAAEHVAARSTLAVHHHAPGHHHLRSHRAVTALSARHVPPTSATPRPAPTLPHPTDRHRATVPSLVVHGKAPRSLRGGAQHVLATPDRGALLSQEARDLGRSQCRFPLASSDPVRSVRGPPRAGPERTPPAPLRPALAGSDADADPPASERPATHTHVSPLDARPAAAPLPAPACSAGIPPLSFEPRSASGRLRVRRREGMAARYSPPAKENLMSKKSVSWLAVLAVLVAAPLAHAQSSSTTGSTSTPEVKAPAPTEPAKTSTTTHSSSHHSAPKVDLNTASREELMKLHGISGETADKIIAARPFKSKDQLVSEKIVTKQEYEKISSHIMVKSTASATKTSK